MAESNLKLADWACSSLSSCAGIISSCFLFCEGNHIGSSLLDVSAILGPLCVPPDIGNGKRLLTKQCSRPGLGVPVLVQTFLPLSGTGALDDRKQEP